MTWTWMYATINANISVWYQPLPLKRLKWNQCSSLWDTLWTQLVSQEVKWKSFAETEEKKSRSMHTICAITTKRPTWRMRVDFPPIFGPVTSTRLAGSSPQAITVSFGMNPSTDETQGWRPSVIFKKGCRKKHKARF